jgi:hypothetical protein
MGKSYNSYDGNNQSMGAYRTDGWDNEKRGSDIQSGRQFDYPAFPQTLEDLELEFKKEAMELGRIRDKEEDDENYMHREVSNIHRAGVHVQSDNWCDKHTLNL